MAYGRRDGFSYADGVPLKINDRLQPPLQVIFPPQSIALPNLFENEYDFSVERNALRQYELHKKTKEALEKAKVDKVAQEIEKFTHVPLKVSRETEKSVQDACPKGHQPSIPGQDRKSTVSWPNGTLLNPQPLVKDQSLDGTPKTKALNLADFESQSSSPFDIIELQTLNDLEELNTVFQGIAVSSPAKTEHAVNHETYAKVVHQPVNGYQVYPEVYHALPDRNMYNGCRTTGRASETFPKLKGSKSTPDIRDEIAQERNSNRSQTPPPYSQQSGQPAIGRDQFLDSCHRAAVGATPPEREGLPNPYHELDEGQQQFSATVAQMGFQLDRVARTVKHLGTDEKKVVDHLCHVQSLEESGYEGNDAETALHLYDYNFEQAKIFLDLLKQFQDLGFSKSAARKALIRHKNDRDKALDFLLLS